MEKLLEIVIQNTLMENYRDNNFLFLSQLLQISKNSVALRLKKLFDEGKLIQIQERPIFYIHKNTCIENRGSQPFKDVYADLDNFLNEGNEDFNRLIGNNGSLKSVVKQCKAAISYPPNGISLLFQGATGTGKSFIAKLAYEYARSSAILSQHSKFLTLNCSEYANNPDLLMANLFGYVKGAFTGADQDTSGLIELANDGVLFLDEVHSLKAECQEKLFIFMDQGVFHKLGNNEKWIESTARLIFATTENPEDVLLKTFLRRIPVIITLPELSKRGVYEKNLILRQVLINEEKRIKKQIKISSNLYHFLINQEFTGNVGEMESCIQSSCVNALFDFKEKDFVEVNIQHLSEKYLNRYSSRKNNMDLDKNELFTNSDLELFTKKKKPIIELYDSLINNIYQVKEFSYTKDEFISKSRILVLDYFDKMTAGECSEFYISGMRNISGLLNDRYGVQINNNNLIAYTRFIAEYTGWFMEIHQNTLNNQKNMTYILDYLSTSNFSEDNMSLDICKYITAYLDIETDEFLRLVFIILFCSQSKELSTRRIGIIIAHGFSTASSIASAVNKSLNNFVFGAIDMPLSTATDDIVMYLNEYLNRYGKFEELFLLVDMGSLEEIYTGLKNKNINVGIINNVSTKIALEIGVRLNTEDSMESIFEDCVHFESTHYHIEQGRRKSPVILCCCASGVGTATKLKSILEQSLPALSLIQVKTFDYATLVESKLKNKVFEEFDVICVVGTLNPVVEGLRFIPIEELIINNEISSYNDYFQDYLNLVEIKEFEKNIVMNFSLNNIMNDLTILNPNKLLEHVAEGLDILQGKLGVTIPNNKCFGLYVHICCLIERLVIQKGIQTYPDLADFEEYQKDFIRCVKESFEKTEKYYSVSITIAEIGYIFDYIKN